MKKIKYGIIIIFITLICTVSLYYELVQPNLYIKMANDETKVALNIKDNKDIVYNAEHTIIAYPNEVIYISTKKLFYEIKFDFIVKKISVYKNNEFVASQEGIVEEDGVLDINVGLDEGTYLYYITMNIKNKGIYEYSFKVEVTNIKEL